MLAGENVWISSCSPPLWLCLLSFSDLGIFFVPWITSVKLLFLWGIFFAVSKNYLTLMSCNFCPPCHKDLLFTLQEILSAEEWKALQQKWEKPEKMEAFYIAGSIRAVPGKVIYFCLSKCVQMLKYTMEVKGRQTLSKLSEVQFTDWVMQPHFWPPPAFSWPALPVPASPPAFTLSIQLPVQGAVTSPSCVFSGLRLIPQTGP